MRMKIRTSSGDVKVDKRSPYGKFLMGFVSTEAWSGRWVLEKAWEQGQMWKERLPSLCWYDLGKMMGINGVIVWEGKKKMGGSDEV